MKEGNKSFEVHTAKEFFDVLVIESYDEFIKNPTSSRYAITNAIFTWHLHDWVWAQYKDILKKKIFVRDIKMFKEYLFRNCKEFQIIQSIANGSKHFESGDESIGSTKLQHGFPIGLTLLFTASHLTISDGSKTIFFSHVIKACIDFWIHFFEEYLNP